MVIDKNPTRRQHYVQCAYLAHFASPVANGSGSIWTYDKHGNSPRLQSLKDTGLEKDIYSIKHPGVKTPDILERDVFTKIENVGYPVLKSLVKEKKRPSLDAEAVGRLSGYLVAAHLRVPRNIDSAKQVMEGVSIELLKAMSRDPKKVKEAWEMLKERLPGETLIEEEVKDLLENPEKHVKVEIEQPFPLLANLMLLSELARELISMRWSVWDSPKDGFFVTGDSPLIVFAQMDSGLAIFGGGFCLPQVQIHFPISPTRCLFLSRTKAPAYMKVSKSQIDEVNRRCIAMAERFVFASRRSNRIQKLVEKYAYSSAGTKVDLTHLAQKLD
jgi:hypothetical protein